MRIFTEEEAKTHVRVCNKILKHSMYVAVINVDKFGRATINIETIPTP